MKKILFSILLICLPFVAFSLEPQKKISLRECYDLAVKHMETVQISEQQIQEAKAKYTQALGEVIPRIKIEASEFLQDDHANTSNTSTTGQVVNTFTRFSRPQVGVNVTQSLFRGFKEIIAMKLAKTNEAEQRYNKEDVERLLYQDVATAFYTVMQVELNIASSSRIIKAYRDRIVELRKRVDLGKSRGSELLAQESELAILEGSLEKEKGSLKVAYEMLSFLTGLDPHPRIRWDDSNKLNLRPLTEYTALAEGRADVMASKKAVDLAKGEVKFKKGDLLPDANAKFNAYPYRAGFQKDIFWDANFALNIPVFNWSTYGLIREAKAKALQTELQSQLLKRQVLREIKSAYDKYQASVLEYRKYNVAAQKSEKSYFQQVEDYNLGLINNLDVIYALNTWLQAIRQRDESKVRVLSDWVSLYVTSGIKP